MSKLSINRKKIDRRTKSPSLSKSTHLKEVDKVVIQITQAFCPNGHNLVQDGNDLFDGSPGIAVWVSDGKTEGKIVISPFHGDHSRVGEVDFPSRTKIEIACPVCKIRFTRLAKCICKQEGELVMIFLTSGLDESNVVGICDVWGCYRSKVFDQAQLLATYQQD